MRSPCRQPRRLSFQPFAGPQGPAIQLAVGTADPYPAQRTPVAVRITPESEAELVKLARTGDRDAFGSLVVRHAGMVRRLTLSVLRHPEDADDAAQEAFLSAWTALDRFDEGQALAPWLARIAVNAARDLHRRRTVRSAAPLDVVQVVSSDAPDRQAGDAMMRVRLDSALATLPDRQRAALVLFEVEGYAAAEIGAILGIPEGTVRSDVFHARRKLRTLLGEKEETA